LVFKVDEQARFALAVGTLGVAWVIREGSQHRKEAREGKSTGKAVPTAVRKTQNLLFSTRSGWSKK
jgi:hypothetical protein